MQITTDPAALAGSLCLGLPEPVAVQALEGNWPSDVRDMLPSGLVAATPDVQTQSKGRLDHVFVRAGLGGTLAVRSALQADPGPLSDHSAWVVGATITASTPTN